MEFYISWCIFYFHGQRIYLMDILQASSIGRFLHPKEVCHYHKHLGRRIHHRWGEFFLSKLVYNDLNIHLCKYQKGISLHKTKWLHYGIFQLGRFHDILFHLSRGLCHIKAHRFCSCYQTLGCYYSIPSFRHKDLLERHYNLELVNWPNTSNPIYLGLLT